MYSVLCVWCVMLCTEGRLESIKKTKQTKTEKNNKMFQLQAHGCTHPLSLGDRLVPESSVPLWIWPKNDRCVVREKVGSRWFLKHKLISSTECSIAKREQKNLDRNGSLKTNELVAPMLDRKTRTGKSGSHWFLEDERIGSSGVRS